MPLDADPTPACWKVLDSNALDKREHWRTETRGNSTAPLPGKTLGIYKPELGLITH